MPLPLTSTDSVSKALETLRLLGAVEKSGESFSLTSLGQSMSAFPLDPKLAKVLLASKTYKCSEEVLSIVSLLSTGKAVVIWRLLQSHCAINLLSVCVCWRSNSSFVMPGNRWVICKHHIVADHYPCLPCFSLDSVFLTPSLKREEAQASRVKFESSEGDHLSLLNVWRAYKSSNQSKDWSVFSFWQKCQSCKTM